MTHVTCRLTAKNRDQLRNPALGSRLWTTCTCSGRVVDAGIPERQRVLSRAARRPPGRVQRATRGTGRLRVHRDRVGALRQRRAAARHRSSVRPAPVPLRVRPRRRLRHKSVALRFSLSLSLSLGSAVLLCSLAVLDPSAGLRWVLLMLQHQARSRNRPTATDETRSSAIAEGPRVASCQLKSCQLPHNSPETTYGPITIAIRARFEYDSNTIRLRFGYNTLRDAYDSSTIQHPTRSYVLSSNNEHVNSFAML